MNNLLASIFLLLLLGLALFLTLCYADRIDSIPDNQNKIEITRQDQVTHDGSLVFCMEV